MEDGKKVDADDDRPPICPACGVTMGITVDEDGSTRDVCLECGFSDDPSKGLRAAASDPELAVAVLAGRGQRPASSFSAKVTATGSPWQHGSSNGST